MSIYINDFIIERFRGIRDLSIHHLNHVNLIVGDNNCGKTSLLEAILLLRNPKDFNNILRVARVRDNINIFGHISTYEALLTLFPYNNFNNTKHERIIKVQACCNGKKVIYSLQGDLSTIMLDEEEQKNTKYYLRTSYKNKNGILLECEAFQGELSVNIDGQLDEKKVTFHEYSIISGRDIAHDHFLKIVYLPPFAHLQGNVFSAILTNENYKNLCINILQLFDNGITDLLLLKNENTNRPVEYVKHKDLGYMPLSAYGDGIKKVLSLSSGIAKAVNGVLLIDEVETAIHSRYFEDIFRFIVSACRKFNVQAFITSHSIEAVDGFLSTQDYHLSDTLEESISVVTLKKDKSSRCSYARVLSGRHVYQNREQFGFEVRL